MLLLLLIILLPFQNCVNKIQVEDRSLKLAGAVFETDPESVFPPVAACQLISCELTPLTPKPAVTTILLALGDRANDQLVIHGASSQLIAETVVRYTTPANNPKILIIKDSNSQSEDPEDLVYLVEVLLSRYNTEVIVETANGISLEDLQSYDLVWLNNPGHPMGSSRTMNSLIQFTGAVVLQGDDLTIGNGFLTEELTKLKHIDNGTSITCAQASYNIDNNSSEKYVVTMNSRFFPQAGEQSNLSFVYGNDIDHAELILNAGVEVLATAKGNPEDCTDSRPAIVRYFK